MSDDDDMARWAKITDLREAVSEFMDNSQFVGMDPYYRDINDALWAMLSRAHAASMLPTETQEPNWTTYEVAGSDYDREIDLNAAEGSEWRWRYRRRARTGEPVAEWLPGLPGTSKKEG